MHTQKKKKHIQPNSFFQHAFCIHANPFANSMSHERANNFLTFVLYYFFFFLHFFVCSIVSSQNVLKISTRIDVDLGIYSLYVQCTVHIAFSFALSRYFFHFCAKERTLLFMFSSHIVCNRFLYRCIDTKLTPKHTKTY